MKDTPQAAAAGEPAAPLILTVQVIENGMIHGGYHHAAGKIMDIPQDAAEYLAKEGKVIILGTA